MTMMDDEYDALQDRLMAYGETGRHAEGERLVRRELEKYPDDPDLLGWLAGMVGSQQRLDEAMEIIDHALSLDPEDDRLLWIKSGLSFVDGDNSQALDASAAAVGIDPDDPENVFKHAGLLAVEGHSEQALAQMTRAAELDPDNPQMHIGLAACHMRTSDWPEAVESLETALRLQPDNAMAWKMLGHAHSGVSRVRPSLEAFGNAIRCDPSQNLAYYMTWPLMNVYYRSRWLQPLIALLVVCAPDTGPWNTGLRVVAAALLAVSVADAFSWLFRGGRVSWRALLLRPRGHIALSAACAVMLCVVFTMLEYAVVTGSSAMAWLSFAPIFALWVLNIVDCMIEPEETGAEGLVARFVESIDYTVGLDLRGLAKRLRRLFAGRRTADCRGAVS